MCLDFIETNTMDSGWGHKCFMEKGCIVTAVSHWWMKGWAFAQDLLMLRACWPLPSLLDFGALLGVPKAIEAMLGAVNPAALAPPRASPAQIAPAPQPCCKALCSGALSNTENKAPSRPHGLAQVIYVVIVCLRKQPQSQFQNLGWVFRTR